MRIAIVDSYYDAVLDRLYAGRPGLDAAPYAEQHDALMGLRFGTSDAYSANLRERGNEATEFVFNCGPLQERWAAEHAPGLLLRAAGKRPDAVPRRLRDRLRRAILRAQLASYDPDVVYVQDFTTLRSADLAALRRDGRLLVGQLGSAPPWDLVARYDLVLTSFPHFVDRVRAIEPACEYFPLAFDERARDALEAPAERDIPVAFVGGVHGPAVHHGGTALLERLCRELDMQMWGYIADQLADDSPIHSHHHGEAWGRDMYAVLARAQIVINRHGDIAERWANNMRLFEATGMGACVLTESARNLPGLFEPDRELVTYDDPDDLVAKVRGLLADPGRRAAVAEAGLHRTLADHTYATRMAELSALLAERLADRG